MHVVLLADPDIPVPPRFYGGIERIVDFLARGLVARGHRVTLFAHPESDVACELVPWRGKSSFSRRDALLNMSQVTAFLAKHRADPPLVHSFARLVYQLPLLPLPLPKLQSYQRRVTPRSVRLGHFLSRGTLEFTACSQSCARSGDVVGRWHVVYNGVELERYRFSPVVGDDAPLVFLGRIERIKGPHHAIEVARRTGRALVIAGNLPERGPDVEYARSVIAQCDGKQVRYAGPVDDIGKNELLGSAACLLMPVEWDEPFGIVMTEALACGTPVLGFGRGSVPEVVREAVSGFVCRDLDEMVHAVGRISELRRESCRRAAEERFSANVVVGQYEDIYRALRSRESMG